MAVTAATSWLAATAALAAGVTVSDSGTPVVSIPITVPPGIAGMEPKLSITHTGAGISGPLGVGWSIHGLSSISRCPTTFAIDTKRASVGFAPTDKLCIDGQRLIPVNASGQPVMTLDDARGVASGYVEFRTEKDTYSRIRAYGIANGSDVNGPAYFKVWTKAGQIFEYGNTADSRIEAQGKNVVMAWAVNRISDTVGNFIDFAYEERSTAAGSGPTAGPTSGKEWNIQRIFYTGRTAQTAANRVDFVYTDRSFGLAEAFQQGSKNLSVRQLTEIRTFTNQQPTDPLPAPGAIPATNSIPVKIVKLAYETSAAPSTARLRLKSIAECAGTAPTKCLPPHEFTYANGGNETYVEQRSFNLESQWLHDKNGTKGLLVGDFNGDGRTDILRWSNNPAENALWFSAPSGSASNPSWTFAAATGFNLTATNLGHSNGCYYSILGDFNGDGRTDILRVFTGYSLDRVQLSCGASVQPTALFLAAADGSFAGPISLPGNLALQRYRRKPSTCGPPGGSENWCVEPPPSFVCGIPPQSPADNFHIGDFNGDGRLDILTTRLPGITKTDVETYPDCIARAYTCPAGSCNRLWVGDGAGGFAEQTGLLPQKSLWTEPGADYQDRLFVDLNDDQRADIISFDPYYEIQYSTPDGYVSRPNTAGCNGPSTLLLDANGDRRLDFFCAGPLNVGLGGESGFSSIRSAIEAAGPFYSEYISEGTFFGRVVTVGVEAADFNGDGRVDILRWNKNPAGNDLWLANADGTYTVSSSFAAWAKSYNLRDNPDPNQPSTGLYDFYLGDFTGRGGVDILRVVDGTGGATRLLTRATLTPPDQLVSVKSPSGSTTQIAYQWLTSPLNPIYETQLGTSQGSSYPVVDIQPALPLVASITNDAGVGSLTTTQRYFYKGMKIDYSGRGALGFREIQREFQGPSGEWLTEVTTHRIDFPFIGSAERAVTRRGQVNQTGQVELSQTLYTYCDKLVNVSGCTDASQSTMVPLRRPYVWKTNATAKDLAGAALPTTDTTTTVTAWGDPDSIDMVTTTTVDAQTRTYRKLTSNTYFPENTTGDTWILGRLDRSTVQSSLTFNAIPTTTAGNAPNATAIEGLPLSVSLNPASVNVVGSAPGLLSANVTANVTGGVPNYTYSWVRTGGVTNVISLTNANQATATFSVTLNYGGSANENFRVTVTDGAANVVTANITVAFSVPTNPPVASISPSPVACYRPNPGVATSSATVSVAGGQAPFSYAWTRISGSRISVSGGQTATFTATLGWSENFTETFRVTVTDALGRTSAPTVNVTCTSPPPLSASVPSSVSGSRIGAGTVTTNSVTVTPSGGTGGYTYAWTPASLNGISPSSTTAQTVTFSASLPEESSAAATFTVTLSDSAGNQVSYPVAVSLVAYPIPTATLSTTNIFEEKFVANGASASFNNSVVATIAKGLPPYTLTWVRTAGVTPLTVTPNPTTLAAAGTKSFSFTATVQSDHVSYGQFQLVVTDARGATGTSAILTVNYVSTCAIGLCP
ncbi:MAG TPA: FG-GAP-like repeat-containing protein [Burkholderiaceae bacterium]|nr:FG-GAP-like repeat-containing protein [Burkholderiaceae bacterium]